MSPGTTLASLVTVFSVLGVSSLAFQEGRPESDVATEAVVGRALPYLARQTGAWIDEHGCTSCHQVPFALWAMNESRARGLEVDGRLVEWNRWSLGFVRDSEDEKTDEVWQLLLSGAATDSELGLEAERARLRAQLTEARQADGRWKAQGQLPDQARPEAETHETTSLWSVHALRGDGAVGPRLDAAQESTSNEHLALRYVAARTLDVEGSGELLERLLDEQNEDGGWGWRLSAKSDALATGQALYALERADPELVQDTIARARSFLATTQNEDGSWSVPSTLARKKGEVTTVASDWGTAWAVIGLLRTLEE